MITDTAAPTAAAPATGRPRLRAAALGVVAAGVLLGVATAVAGPTATPSPVVAVGDAVVRLSPPSLTSQAIRLFGTWDKAVLLGVVTAVVLALAAVAGVLARRSRLRGAALAGLLAATGALAAASAPGAGPLDVVPVVVGAVAGIGFLVTVVPALTRGRGPGPIAEAAPAASRRTFLLVTGAAAATGAALLVAGRTVLDRARDAVASRAALTLPVADIPAPPVPDGAEVSPTTPFRTPNADFYRIDTALSVPRVAAEDWSLRIHGLVEREVVIDWADLTARRAVDRWITLACVSNQVGGDLVGNAVWRGTPLGDLLAEAGPAADADMVLSTSTDGYTASTPLEALLDTEDALLAYGMNGEPLPFEHGFPVRMVVAGLYGYVSATKWVVDLEVTRFADAAAFWTPRGYAEQAPVKTASRIDVPRPFAELSPGPVTVAGVAWAPGRGVGRVEVRVDRGPWQQADLAPVPAATTWRQWTWSWEASGPGSHTLEVRATDGDGDSQTEERAPVKPDGATGWHSVVVRVT